MIGRAWDSSTDLDAGVGQKDILRHIEVARRGADPHASSEAILRAMAVAKPAAILALHRLRGAGFRRATKMRASSDQPEPLGLGNSGGRMQTVLIGCRRIVGQAGVARERIEQLLRLYRLCHGDLPICAP